MVGTSFESPSYGNSKNINFVTIRQALVSKITKNCAWKIINPQIFWNFVEKTNIFWVFLKFSGKQTNYQFFSYKIQKYEKNAKKVGYKREHWIKIHNFTIKKSFGVICEFFPIFIIFHQFHCSLLEKHSNWWKMMKIGKNSHIHRNFFWLLELWVFIQFSRLYPTFFAFFHNFEFYMKKIDSLSVSQKISKSGPRPVNGFEGLPPFTRY